VNLWTRPGQDAAQALDHPSGAGYAANPAPETDQAFVTACSALADPVRATVVQLLADRDMSAGEIAACFPVSRPAVSRHLAVLLKSQLLEVRSQSGRRVYSLDLGRLEAIGAWIDQCRAHRRSSLGAATYSR
jgi:DNA-binding transcriptional ArsR family regulator